MNSTDLTKKNYNTMELKGNGSLSVVPDMAVINLGVETINSDLKTAQEQNSSTVVEIINNLKDMGIDEKDIKTAEYNIRKDYDYVSGEQVFKGYKVTYMLEIIVNDINLVGDIIDSSVEKGANIIRNISFEVKNPSNYYEKALNLSLKDAIEKAESIGRQLEVKVNSIPILITEESYSASIPYAKEYAVRDTPIEVGQNKINASINCTFSYH
jgi:uncharacterized protein YggE